MSKKDVNIFIGAIDKTKAAFKSVAGGMKKIHAGAGRMAAGMKRGFGVARRAILGVGVALAGTVVEAVRYNQQMARAWTMMSGNKGQFKAMRADVKGLSQEFGIAKSELADGLYNALSAGVPENNVIDFLKTSAGAAVADGSDVATAVDGITTVLNAFNMKSTEAEHVADLMFQTVKGGKTTFADLSSNIAQAAATASAMGVSAEDVMGSVAHLTKNGMKTETVMVNLRNIMLSLNKALGEGWSESMGLSDALNKVYDQTGGSQLSLEALFGKRNLPAVLKMVGVNAAAAKMSIDSMVNSAGAKNEAMDKQDQFRHWNKGFQAVRAVVDSIGKVLDDKLEPIVERITAKLTALAGNKELWAAFADGYDKYAAPVMAQLEGLLDPATRERSATNLRQGLVAIALDMGDGIMRILKMGAPMVGDAIGRSVKGALAWGNKDAVTDDQKSQAQLRAGKETSGRGYIAWRGRSKELINEAEAKNRDARLKAEGLQLAGGKSAVSNFGEWKNGMARSTVPSRANLSAGMPGVAGGQPASSASTIANKAANDLAKRQLDTLERMERGIDTLASQETVSL